MKYIVTKTEDGELEIFTFPRSIEHVVMAEAVERLKNQLHGDWRRITRTPVSAGFVDNGVCHGRSETLRLDSRPGDTSLFRAAAPEYRQVLPAGSIIEYDGVRATVLFDDGGDEIKVEVAGAREMWNWTLGGISCTVVSVPAPAAPKP